MADHPIQDLLKQAFPTPNPVDWSVAAARELLGKDPFEVLAWETNDKIKFFPYYDQRNYSHIGYLKNFAFPPSANENTGAREWQCIPKISVLDNNYANTVALNHLANGAEGILFDVSTNNSIDIQVLLNQIDWPYCNVSFVATSDSKVVQDLVDYSKKQHYTLSSLSGAIYWKDFSNDRVDPFKTLSPLNKFQPLGIHILSSTPVKEISEALSKATMLLDRLTDQGIEKENVFNKISLSIPVDTDFFSTIAKLKACRMLWYQLAVSFDIKEYNSTNLHINARSESWIDESFQPHGNLIKSSVAALAAVLGGCDSLTIVPEDENNITMNRVARNVSNIIREESYLDKVADPVAGSYAVDCMVDQIAQAAWEHFQHSIERS